MPTKKKRPRPQPKPKKQPRVIDKKPAFLAAFTRTASLTKAAELVKITRSTHYDWHRDDEEYRAAFAAAREQAADALEDEVVRRAHEGHKSPIVHHGELCYPLILDPETGELKRSLEPLMEVKHSDQLLMFYLKALRPEKYRENIKAEITGSVDIVERLAAARKRLKRDDEEK